MDPATLKTNIYPENYEISWNFLFNGPFSGRTQVTPSPRKFQLDFAAQATAVKSPSGWESNEMELMETSGCFLIHVFCWHQFFFLEEIFRPLGLDAFLFWQVCLLERLLQRRFFLGCLGLPKTPKDSTRWKLLLIGGFVPWKLIVRRYQSFRKFGSFSQIISLYRGLPKSWNSG